MRENEKIKKSFEREVQAMYKHVNANDLYKWLFCRLISIFTVNWLGIYYRRDTKAPRIVMEYMNQGNVRSYRNHLATNDPKDASMMLSPWDIAIFMAKP
jgi:hypothetical protein